MTHSADVFLTGLYFGEAPRWRDGRLWFSDFFDHAVKSVSLKGDVRTELQIEDQPSGLGWTPDGELLVVSMTRRQLLRRSLEGCVHIHADLSQIATCHCNDMVVDAQGRAYVGNFGFDLDKALKEGVEASALGAQGTARLALVEADGSSRTVAEDLYFPNGAVITPDGGALIIAETFGARLTAFDISPAGDLSNRRIWANLGERVPDGICLDAEGAIWIANAMAPECVRIAEGGVVLQIVETSQPCFACMLGGDDGRTLFMMTAPPLATDNGDQNDDGEKRRGRIEIARVTAPHAGRP